MNKTELITQVAASSGIAKKDTERVIEAAIDAITAALAGGEKVQLTGFGTFEVKKRQARVGRNPKTRETVQIPATNAVTFKPSKNLKDIVGE